MIKLDNRDIEILRVLSVEGRISKSELAKRVNLSLTPTGARLRRLEEAGIIRGYHAEIDLAAFQNRVEVFVTLELERHKAIDFSTFEEVAQGESKVLGCWALGGGYDYLLRVVAKDIEEYQSFMENLLDSGVGVQRYFTYVVTKQIKNQNLHTPV